MSSLSKEEREKAAAFVKEKDRRAYLLSHIYLRKILSFYFPEVSVETWLFGKNGYGKPFIEGPLKEVLYFNLSHTRSCAYIVCSSEALCGIDVEEKREMEISEGMAEILFSKEELLCYKSLETVVQEEMFYRYWTLKEAHLKALGTGLMEVPLQQLDFSHKIALGEEKTTFTEGNNFYCSESMAEERFLAFSILNANKDITPRYLEVPLKFSEGKTYDKKQ